MLNVGRRPGESLVLYRHEDGPFLHPLMITNLGRLTDGRPVFECQCDGHIRHHVVALNAVFWVEVDPCEHVAVMNCGNKGVQVVVGIEAPKNITIIRGENYVLESTPPAARGRMTRATEGTATEPAVRTAGGVNSIGGGR